MTDGKYYSLERIKKEKAEYNVIFGEKSNGKTDAVLNEALERYFKTGEQMAYVRRWQEDINTKTTTSLWADDYITGRIKELSEGKWNGTRYYRGAWYMAKGEKKADAPFAFAFAISMVDHYNGGHYPGITTFFFDEFMTRGMYVPDEVSKFFTLLSIVVRDRENVTIYMVGNTVNKYNPYFKEMGLESVEYMAQGDVSVFKTPKAKVAVEYCKTYEHGKPSDKYFTFNTKSVSMITHGAWEVAEYPKSAGSYSKGDVKFNFFVEFNGHMLQADYVVLDGNAFIHFYPKKGPLKDPDRDIIFSDQTDYRRNWYSSITRPVDELSKAIIRVFQAGKVFFSDNSTGEILRNYIMYSVQQTGMRKIA